MSLYDVCRYEDARSIQISSALTVLTLSLLLLLRGGVHVFGADSHYGLPLIKTF